MAISPAGQCVQAAQLSLLLPSLKGSLSYFIRQNMIGDDRTLKIMEGIWKEFWFHNSPAFHYNSQHMTGIQHDSFSTESAEDQGDSYFFTHIFTTPLCSFPSNFLPPDSLYEIWRTHKYDYQIYGVCLLHLTLQSHSCLPCSLKDLHSV